jgi:hypothetical protein
LPARAQPSPKLVAPTTFRSPAAVRPKSGPPESPWQVSVSGASPFSDVVPQPAMCGVPCGVYRASQRAAGAARPRRVRGRQARSPAALDPTEIQRFANPALGDAPDARVVLRASSTVLVLAVAALPGCAGVEAAGQDPPATAAGVRAETLAGVARRIYHQEAGGDVGHAAVKRIARDRALLRALGSGDRAALRASALRQLFNPGKHVVRLAVVRRGRVLVDVGGAFVVSPAHRELRAADGADLGRLEASMQDVVGYVKLVHRLTGADVVVRGAPGHVESSLTPAPATLPLSGTATIAGRAYVVRSFPEAGFAGEPLTVWVLSRA